MTSTSRAPVLFLIYTRPGPGHRWQRAGRTSTRAEAETLIGSAGEWLIAPLTNPALADAEPAADARPADAKPDPFPAATTGPA